MITRGIRGAVFFAAITTITGFIAGCSHTDGALRWSDADTPPSGYRFLNGFPPSSEGPPPAWYAKRFNLPRGLGEAIKRNHRALWERGPGTFAYYVGGRFFAQYQPWEHYLEIRTEHKDATNINCHWDPNGALTIAKVGGGVAPAGSEKTCSQLLDALQNHVAPQGLLAHNTSR